MDFLTGMIMGEDEALPRLEELPLPEDGFPIGFMDGTAASMLDFVLMGGDLQEALGLKKIG